MGCGFRHGSFCMMTRPALAATSRSGRTCDVDTGTTPGDA
nr:MAG TPA_asm: hypothetical protein [Caudoviricetes sp.]DAV74415.1 MAG TPA: hypothetical protein [Caudoviricetes sp.]